MGFSQYVATPVVAGAISLVFPGAPGISLGVLLGLLVATAWGVSDFLARGISRVSSPLAALLGSSLVASGALSLWLPFGGGFDLASLASPAAWGVIAAVAVLFTLGNLALYHAFLWGPLAVISPICSSCTAVAAGIGLLSGERVAPWTLVGIASIFVGVTLVTATRRRHERPRGEAPRLLPSPVAQRLMTRDPFGDDGDDGDDGNSVTSSTSVASIIPTSAVASVVSVAPAGAGEPSSDDDSHARIRHSSAHQSGPRPGARPGPGLATVVVVAPRTAEGFPLRLALPPPVSTYRRRFWLLTCRDSTAGIIAAVTAAVMLGTSLWILRFVPTTLSAGAANWLERIIGSALLAVLFLVYTRPRLLTVQRALRRLRHPWHLQRSVRRWLLLLAVGSLDAGALTAYLLGVRVSSSPLVAAIASLDTVVVVGLALLLLRERLARLQWVGVSLTFVGLILASMGR